MCQATNAFDPTQCPLLQNLSPEEQQARMRDDPRIAACIEALKCEVLLNPKTAKFVRAYKARTEGKLTPASAEPDFAAAS